MGEQLTGGGLLRKEGKLGPKDEERQKFRLWWLREKSSITWIASNIPCSRGSGNYLRRNWAFRTRLDRKYTLTALNNLLCHEKRYMLIHGVICQSTIHARNSLGNRVQVMRVFVDCRYGETYCTTKPPILTNWNCKHSADGSHDKTGHKSWENFAHNRTKWPAEIQLIIDDRKRNTKKSYPKISHGQVSYQKTCNWDNETFIRYYKQLGY